MPDNLRAIRGTNPQRAESHTGVKAVRLSPIAPNPPASLKGEALAEWKRIVPELNARKLLAKVDRAVLTEYCTAWSLSRQALAILEQEGLIVADGEDDWRKNPAWQIWRESTAMTAALAKELLITPNARLRATMPEVPDGETGAADILD
jgi:P27 family predicted phage terminase small subunit